MCVRGVCDVQLGETKQVDIKNATEAAKSFASRPHAKFTFIASRRKRDRYNWRPLLHRADRARTKVYTDSPPWACACHTPLGIAQ
jgi:hypothetical protein